MLSIYKNIKRLRQEQDMTQEELAIKVGYADKSMIAKIEAGKVDIPQSKIVLLAEALHTSPRVLMGWGDDDEDYSNRPVRLPVYGRIAAGISLEMITDIEDWEEIPADMADRGEFIALKIAGDSMEPRIRNGDVVIVRRQEDAETGDTIVATVNGCDATCKRLQKYADGIALLSNNQAYEPMIFTAQQVEELPVRILGKVVELRGKF